MPELPEVETFARSLHPHVVGQVLAEIWGSGVPLRRPVDLAALRAQRGARILSLTRTGKYLLFHLSSERVLVSHLGMSGRFLLSRPDEPLAPHTHLRFSFVGANHEVRYLDPRRFGCALLVEPGRVQGLLRLGPDPLGEGFSPEGLLLALRGSRRDLKSLLLDQSLVAGLGNIYVAEALFHAGLRPTRRGEQITKKDAAALHQAIREVLSQAVERRGTTLSDGGYVDAEGQTGENQDHLQVYGRDGLPCRSCGAAIRRLVQAGRSSFYCPRCQK
jgi:formamidopyrimidine-DNA glycosylase